MRGSASRYAMSYILGRLLMIRKLFIAFALLMGGSSLAQAGPIEVGGVMFTPGQDLTISFTGSGQTLTAHIQSGASLDTQLAASKSSGVYTIFTGARSASDTWLSFYVSNGEIIAGGLMNFHLPAKLSLPQDFGDPYLVAGVSVVPEPAILFLIGIGLLAALMVFRKKNWRWHMS